MHTEWSDGWDDVATVIGLAEYLQDPEFLAYHPEYEGNALDFISITDHRTVDAQSDPDYASDLLVLVGGEEFGSSGHANTLGVHAFVDHDPDGDGVTLSDIEAAVDDTHAQGAVFSPNHPFLPDIPFPWDIRNHDAIEVWNSGWNLMSPENTEEELLDWEASHGEASPLYWRAIEVQGQGSSMQALAWYEAQISRGVHVALVGGSDRHAVFLPGFPTTWVRSETTDEAGIVEGIGLRHTFVSRTPVSGQLLVEVERDGETWEMGDAVPVPASGATVTVSVRVGRAAGGRLEVVAGSSVESDQALADAELGSVILEEEVAGEDHLASLELEVIPGDWFYPRLFEPLLAPGLTDDQQALVEEIALAAVEMGEEDFTALAQLAASLVDTEVLGNASQCDPGDWEPDRLQCAPVDDEGMASFFVPDLLDRALNVVSEGDEPTDWSVGAVGSAVRFVEESR